MTQDLKEAGGAAESQEPWRSLTSTVPSRSTKTSPALQGLEAQEPTPRIRTGRTPYRDLCMGFFHVNGGIH